MHDAQYARAIAAAALGRSQNANLGAASYTGNLPFLKAPPIGRYSTRVSDHVVDESNVAAVFAVAEEAAAWLVKTANIQCTAGNLAGCLGPLVQERGAILFGRPLASEEVQGYVEVALDLAADLGAQGAIEAAFEALLRAPQFLYRAELGAPGAGLSTFELAQAISYGVTDGPPDTALWQAAESGALQDPATVRQHVERLLANLGERAPLRAFLEEFVHYDKVLSVSKTPEQYPFHNADALLEDSKRTLQHTLSQNGATDFLRTLLTYQSGYVRSTTAVSFGLDSGIASEPAYAPFPTGTRAGFLTEPAWLVAHSEPERNNPVSRGKFIRVELLCGVVPPIPIEVDVMAVPDEPTQPLKQILTVHRTDPSCAGCHALMDPLGLTFERFDHVGRYRDQEFGLPIDATGELTGSGNQDGAVVDALELAQRLAASTTVEQCFSKQAYQFFAGYDPTSADGCALTQIHGAFGQRQSLVDLLAALYAPSIYGEKREN
jgi:hypothetical protein